MISMSKAKPRRRLKDPDHERLPALRISHIVYGREKQGPRVLYLLDPKEQGSEKAIAEQVVLHRWRRRKFEGFTFSGARLSPNLWRALPRLFGDDVSTWESLTEDQIQKAFESKESTLEGLYVKSPGSNIIQALIKICGPDRLRAITNRHSDPNRSSKYGTPDLFLYATKISDGTPCIARFVEVKKPEESVSPDQHEEIHFLQSIGLHARVLRLDERE